MNVLRTNITLPKVVFKHLQMSVPQGQRSKFIARAIIEKLGEEKTKEEALKISLKANSALYNKESDIWKVTEIERWPESANE